MSLWSRPACKNLSKAYDISSATVPEAPDLMKDMTNKTDYQTKLPEHLQLIDKTWIRTGNQKKIHQFRSLLGRKRWKWTKKKKNTKKETTKKKNVWSFINGEFTAVVLNYEHSFPWFYY